MNDFGAEMVFLFVGGSNGFHGVEFHIIGVLSLGALLLCLIPYVDSMDFSDNRFLKV